METRRDVFQAIADPTRREILTRLVSKRQPVNALSEQFDMSRQAISLHLKILKECGVITMRKEGRERLCELKPKKLNEVVDWLEKFKEIWEGRFQQLDDVLLKLKTKE